MARAAFPRGVLVVLAAFAFIGVVVLVDAARPRGGPDMDLARGGPKAADERRDDEAIEEAREQAEKAELRHEAWEAAVRAGTAGQKPPITSPAAAPGWAGEQPLDTSADDWEPAIAADPSAPWVYALVTRYGAGKPCPGNCPSPWIALEISADGGATWGPGTPLCACKGSGQFDPIIEVVPGTGAVYAAYMNGYNVVFVKSTNHGATWTSPVKTYGNVSWNDKPVLAASDDGRHVYISFNGPTGGDPWVAQSHDFGASWTQRKLTDGERYVFAFDADVAPDGTVYFAETSILYGGGGNKGTTPNGPIEEHVYVSTDQGATFTDRMVASVEPGLACLADGCPPDYYLGHSALRSMRPVASSCSTTVRPWPAGPRQSGPSPRRTAAPHGRPRSACPWPARRPWRRPLRPGPAAMSAPGTCRRPASTWMPGTSGTAARPTAG